MREDMKAFASLFRRGYIRLFIEEWDTLTGAVLIGILSVFCFAWARPWGVVGGLRVWADWLFYSLGLYGQTPPPAWTDTNSLITLGLIWGALAASLIAGQFAFRKPPGLELVKGLIGGALLGIGSGLAGGCNVGGFYSSVSALSGSGLVMMIGLLAGAYVGLKYLYWEMERFPSSGEASTSSGGATVPAWVRPALGWVLLFACIATVYGIYKPQGRIIEGGVLLSGLGFGMILVRSRLCFARAFREPFMTGDATVTKAVIVSLAISVTGFSLFKWGGMRPEIAYIAPNFGLGALVGGFIFGFGMLMTGGCGSGTAWRAAEGQVKLMAALVIFALSNSLTKALLNTSPEMSRLVGVRLFLPDYLGGYLWSLLCVLLVMGIWYMLASWNEETDRFVVEM
jgi:uncharacterized protein